MSEAGRGTVFFCKHKDFNNKLVGASQKYKITMVIKEFPNGKGLGKQGIKQ